jgi:hypothetical protein
LSKPVQSLANHARFVPLYHFVCSLLLMANVWMGVMGVRNGISAESLVGLGTSLALLLLFFYARSFALTVQDRVIRLEMKLRLNEIAPDLGARFGEFEPAQLVALRFAGDAELPGLARQVLDGKLVSNGEIKKAVKDWQADWLRA